TKARRIEAADRLDVDELPAVAARDADACRARRAVGRRSRIAPDAYEPRVREALGERRGQRRLARPWRAGDQNPAAGRERGFDDFVLHRDSELNAAAS